MAVEEKTWLRGVGMQFNVMFYIRKSVLCHHVCIHASIVSVFMMLTDKKNQCTHDQSHDAFIYVIRYLDNDHSNHIFLIIYLVYF